MKKFQMASKALEAYGIQPAMFKVLLIINLVALLIILYFSLSKHPPMRRILVPGILSIAFTFLLVNTVFFPYIFRYHGAIKAAKIANQDYGSLDGLFTFSIKGHDNASYFYAGQQVSQVKNTDQLVQVTQKSNVGIYTSVEGLDIIDSPGGKAKFVDTLNYYSLQKLRPKFINPNIREETLEKRFLLKF